MMDFSIHIRSIEHIKKQIPLSLEREWRTHLKLETPKERSESMDKLAAIRAKLEDFEKAADHLVSQIRSVAS